MVARIEKLDVNLRFKENVSEEEETALWSRIFEILEVFEEETPSTDIRGSPNSPI